MTALFKPSCWFEFLTYVCEQLADMFDRAGL